MEPDPIRRAFDKMKTVSSLHDFTAGAKWAARETTKMCDAREQEPAHNGWAALRSDAARDLADKIRKHFGVEGEAP